MVFYLSKKKALKNIIKEIPSWSKELQSQNAISYYREVSSAHNFVTDYGGRHWTFGKSVGADGKYHFDGAGARYRLEKLGFWDALDPKNAPRSLRQGIERAFKKWAQKVLIKDLSEKLDRFNEGELEVKFRLMVPPNFSLSKLQYYGKLKAKSKKKISRGQGHISANRTLANFDKFQEGYNKEIHQEITSRNQSLIKSARKYYEPKCVVCGFEFGPIYGKHGIGFIEFHHLIPLSEGGRATSLKDIVPVCANCHRMLHRGKQIMRINDLKKLLC
jgi:hypothetical protein